MVCCRYAKDTESKNHPTDGTGQASDCPPAGLLCSVIGQRGNPLCVETSGPGNRAAIPTHHAPIRNAASIPVTLRQGFYAAV